MSALLACPGRSDAHTRTVHVILYTGLPLQHVQHAREQPRPHLFLHLPVTTRSTSLRPTPGLKDRFAHQVRRGWMLVAGLGYGLWFRVYACHDLWYAAGFGWMLVERP